MTKIEVADPFIIVKLKVLVLMAFTNCLQPCNSCFHQGDVYIRQNRLHALWWATFYPPENIISYLFLSPKISFACYRIEFQISRLMGVHTFPYNLLLFCNIFLILLMVWHVSRVQCFSLLSGILLYEYTNCLAILLLKNTWVVFSRI